MTHQEAMKNQKVLVVNQDHVLQLIIPRELVEAHNHLETIDAEEVPLIKVIL